MDPKQIIASLDEDGEIARKLSFYEPRQAQLDLLELIVNAFNEDALLMAEAGTGVGKSFAYLLPAARFALEKNEKVVISTATITLQQQLFQKDIPLVASAIGKDIKAVVMKGRGNYVCLRRLDDAIKEPSLDDRELNEIKQIGEWSGNTKTGEKSELSFTPSENAWSNVRSESDLCLGIHCPWRENCFALKTRKEASGAKIIVVNHHLLFADLAARFQGAGYENAVVLPPFTRLIIDEAHKIEDAATSFFSAEFTKAGMFRQLSRLYYKRRRAVKGLLVRLYSFAFNSKTKPSGENTLEKMAKAIQKIRDSAEKLDERALELCGDEGIFRFSPSADDDFLKKSIFPCFVSLRKNILALVNMIRDVSENIDEDYLGDPTVWETRMIVRRFEDTAEICDAFCKYKKHEDDVFWIEKQRFSKAAGAVYTKTPLDLSPLLKDSVFSPNKTVVCVSATLAINGDFSYWAGRCGIALNNRPLLSGCFPSPFPYSNAVLLAAPADAPLPDSENWQSFIDKAITSLVSIAGGSALVLFTSYQSLSRAYAAAKDKLASLGIRCLKQGDDDRSRLLRDFVSDTNSCLFATDSFWEGVDAPGDTLRLVIICRLPFRIPGDPVYEARREAVEKSGGNPFLELSLPQAVMKFKQGFGRLMRRSGDHGVVAVLDSRLLKKNYGQLFLRSLPETKVSFSDFDNILKDMENFIF